MNVLAFGEVLWDIIDKEHYLGGAPLNFAAHVIQCGYKSSIISCLGHDKEGELAMQEIKSLGLDTALIQRRRVKTGYVPVTVKNGQPAYEIIRDVAYDYILSNELNHDTIREFDTFYFGTLIQRGTKSEESLYQILDKHDFKDIFYDVNLRKESYSKAVILNSLSYSTIFKLNNEEVETLGPLLFDKKMNSDTFCSSVKSEFPNINIIIITNGEEGSYIYFDGKGIEVRTEHVEVTNTVGAGDAYSAAFMSALETYGNPARAAVIANKIGGFVASSAEAVPKYTSEIQELFV